MTYTSTHVNADLACEAIEHAADAVWLDSPEPGVKRRMLDRIGGEVARATSIVRFAAGASFPFHVHGGGEEILVLKGVFEDENGRYPAGFYMRHLFDTRHAPFSTGGCKLFVKLHQFDPEDRQPLQRDTRAGE